MDCFAVLCGRFLAEFCDLTEQLRTRFPQFYLPSPAPCPYLAGRMERKVFTRLSGEAARSLNDALTHAGFRRSQNIAYKPSCEACQACVSVRVLVDEFQPNRTMRRISEKNRQLHSARVTPVPTSEQYDLFRTYIDARHSDGGMAEMGRSDYAAMVEETAVRTHIVEYRYTSGSERGELAAAALVDVLGDGLSLVYSYFDPVEPRRSLGIYTILDHIQQARAAGFAHLHLGYWIPGSEKMDYKAAFRPLELLLAGQWRPYEPVEF